MTHRTIESTFTHEPDRGNHAMSRSRIHHGLAIAALALELAGCGGAAPATATARGKGGTSKAEAAQPTCTGSGAHDKHQSLGFGCTVCHPGDGGTYGFETYAYPGGTSTGGGVILLGSAAGPTTCTVACHAPLGSPVHPVAWTTTGPLDCTSCHATSSLVPSHPKVSDTATRDGCLACHDQAQHATGTVRLVSHPPEWMDQTNAGFHAVSAIRGLAPCEDCHGSDLKGLANAVACGSCHDKTQPDGSVLAWSTNCTMCHGGTDNQTGAPPRTTWGNDADTVRVGAHSVHLAGSAIAPPFGCDLCHVKPAAATDPGHINNPTATVTFGGLATLRATATTSPTWTRASATCSNVYCHGNGLTGGRNTAPVWTAGPSQAACGTCHGLPPPSAHPVVANPTLAACSGCHPATVDVSGNVIAPTAGGKHLDGVVEATSGHEPSWMDPGSTGFHAFTANLGIAACQGCHGAMLDGVGAATTVACASCHKPGGPGRDFGTCTACHGGGDNASGAPPVATWGHAGDPSRGGGTLDAIRVGAHTVHLAGGPLASPLGCDACHVVPASIVDPTHIDTGFATVTFGTVARAYGAAPAFSRSTGTCSSTYCHGATIRQQELIPGANPRGTNVAPVWTAGPSQATCGTCHGLPPDTGKHFQHGVTGQYGFVPCSWCHYGYQDSPSPYTDRSVPVPALHVNGVKDVVISPDAADGPANAYTRIGGWDAPSCHSVVACHGLMY